MIKSDSVHNCQYLLPRRSAVFSSRWILIYFSTVNWFYDSRTQHKKAMFNTHHFNDYFSGKPTLKQSVYLAGIKIDVK